MADGTCCIPDCEDPVRNIEHGWCIKHYTRFLRHGDPLVTLRALTIGTPEERFWAKVNKNGPVPAHRPELGPCWIWTAGTFKYRGGYGQFNAGTSSKAPQIVYAHRFAWVLCNGPIPDGLGALHHCDDPPCVKPIADPFGPSHLFLGTQVDNSENMARKGRSTARITIEVARAIKDRSAAGMGRQQIAEELGVSIPLIKSIRAGKTWRHA